MTMNFKHILIVLKKELKDMTRDKRTIISSILLPMIIIPIMYYFMGSSSDNLSKNIEENLVVAVVNTENTEQIEQFLKNSVFKNNNNITIISTKDSEKSLLDDEIRVAIKIDDDYENKLQNNIPINIDLTYDSSKMTSRGSLSIITDIIKQFEQNEVLNRINLLGLNQDIITPTIIQTQDISPKDSGSNQMLSMILPMILSIFLVSSGAPAAIDAIAGERERKTFEPLLTTKANRFSILLAKYIAISMFSFISVITSLIGVVIGMKLSPGMFGSDIGMNLSISIVILLIALLTIILFGFMCAAIQLGLSAFAKSIKEAGTYTTFLMFTVMIPAYATMYMQVGDIKTYMAFIPGLNIIALMKMLLSNVANISFIGITFAMSIVYFIVILLITFKLFKKENIVIR
jgi:sodium transport system permease protein